MFRGHDADSVARDVSRRIKRGRRCYAFGSAKNPGVLVSMESLEEKKRALLFELDPAIESFREQPFVIELLSGEIRPSREHFRDLQLPEAAKPTFYTPDFLCRMCDARRIVVEVKSERVPDALREKYARAKEVLMAQGYEFRLLTNQGITPALVVNIEYLKRTTAEYLRPALPTLLARLVELAEARDTWGIQELAALNPHGVFGVYVGLAHGVFRADITANLLIPEATVQSAAGDLSHLQVGFL